MSPLHHYIAAYIVFVLMIFLIPHCKVVSESSGRVENPPGDRPIDRGGFRSRSGGLPASLVIRSWFSSFPMQYILRLVTGLCAEFACLPVCRPSKQVNPDDLVLGSSTPQDCFFLIFGGSKLFREYVRIGRIGLQIWWFSTA